MWDLTSALWERMTGRPDRCGGDAVDDGNSCEVNGETKRERQL